MMALRAILVLFWSSSGPVLASFELA